LNKKEAKIRKYQVEVDLLTKENFENERTRTLSLLSRDTYKTAIGFFTPPIIERDTYNKHK
jgi:hypothetical protein